MGARAIGAAVRAGGVGWDRHERSDCSGEDAVGRQMAESGWKVAISTGI